jgi:hypothetical protein
MKPLTSLLSFQKSNATWNLPVLSGVGMGLLLWGGWHFGWFAEAKLAALASLSILYFPTSEKFKKQFIVLAIAGSGFIVSYIIGIFNAGSGVFIPIWLGVYAGAVYGLLQYLKMRRPPGTFFFVMLTAMASFIENRQANIGSKIAVMAMGFAMAVLLALIHFGLTYRKERSPVLSPHRFVPHMHLTEAMIFGIVIGFACHVAILLELDSPYWVVVSCLAVMQGSSRGHVWQRSAQRFLGTLIGSLAILGFINLQPPFFLIILAIVISQITLEYLVSRNYAVAVVFVTILTVFFSISETNMLNSGIHQLQYRVIDISVGCIIGAIGGWLIYHYRLKRIISRTIAKMKLLQQYIRML